MPVSVREMVLKASSIHERKFCCEVLAGMQNAASLARLERWRAAVTHDEPTSLQSRLSWDGMTEDDARRLLDTAGLRWKAAIPSWVGTLEEVLTLAGTPLSGDRCIDPTDPIPFEDILIPFVMWARRCLLARSTAAPMQVSERARIDMERELLGQLSVHASRCFALEFALEEPECLVIAEVGNSRSAYEAFVRGMLAGGLVAFFQEYSVLARVLSTTCELWVDGMCELLQRFRADEAAIARMIEQDGPLGIASIDRPSADPHQGLRSVLVLTMTSGRRLVYKPRSLGIEFVWNRLLQWLEVNGSPQRFRTFNVLDRGTYGWAEFVCHEAVEEPDTAAHYWSRAGALLCVVHLLRGMDFHANNVISAGEHPVLVDVETLLTPRVREREPVAESLHLARRRLSASVLSTYLLPYLHRRLGGGEIVDGSGFGVIDRDERLYQQSWVDINTNKMRRAYGSALRGTRSDAKSVHVRPELHDYESVLIDGFANMYRFVVSIRKRLFEPTSVFHDFRNQQIRFVYRSTGVYSTILNSLNHPSLLRDGAERSLAIERLSVASIAGVADDGHEGWQHIWNVERQAIEKGDVPYFSCLASDTSLTSGADVSIPLWFASSAHDSTIAQIAEANETNLAFECDLIRSAIRSSAPSNGSFALLPCATEADVDVSDASSICLSEATRVGRLLSDEAIVGADGSASWLEPVWPLERMLMAPQRSAAVDVVGNDLYDGAVGIAVFLAALERVASGSGFRDLALAALRPLIVELESRPGAFAAVAGVGGLSGMGSIVYGLTKTGVLLRDERLIDFAATAAKYMSPGAIDDDRYLDVTTGAAGAVLGLLALYDVRRDDATLEQATLYGRQIIRWAGPAVSGNGSLPSFDGVPSIGFAHGASGLAYAVLRLYEHTGQQALLRVGRDLFDLDLRADAGERSRSATQPGSQGNSRQWCRGVTGVCLAKIGSVKWIDAATLTSDIDNVLSKLMREETDDRKDTMCCGAFGVVNTLLTAGERLQRRDAEAYAQRLATRVVRRSQGTGYRLGAPSAGRLACRGLFQGLAGVGYTLLRVACREALPELPEVLLLA